MTGRGQDKQEPTAPYEGHRLARVRVVFTPADCCVSEEAAGGR